MTGTPHKSSITPNGDTPAKQLSRRDWFRLKGTQASDSAANIANPGRQVGAEGERWQAVALPPNHDGLDLAALPPMREAVLSTDDVNELFSDIAQLATEVTLMRRTTRARRANGAPLGDVAQLAAAEEALLSGQIPRLQIRYRWNDALWIDTLSRQAAGFHLIRIAHHGKLP